MVNQAVKHDAEILSDTIVEGWSANDEEVEVATDAGVFKSKQLIISAGAWSPELLPDLGLGLQVVQKQQQWFQLDRVDQKIQNEFPCFLFEQSNGDCFYGVPEIDYLGMKVCEHSGGRNLSDPHEIDREFNQAEFDRTDAFMKSYLDFGKSRMVHSSTCMYTMSNDGHFIVDRHPAHSNVVFAAGLSGHGFKFAPVLGEYLVNLLEGNCEPEFEFFKIRNGA
jgi:glycine/D-amino acid oxidase-like deaminating enzyme